VIRKPRIALRILRGSPERWWPLDADGDLPDADGWFRSDSVNA